MAASLDAYRLSLPHGTALLLGAVLGPGVLALPHLAAASVMPATRSQRSHSR